VAPKRFGTETRRGLLEAIAAGVPVVVSPDGIDGLSLQNGREVFVEGSPAGFSERLIELLQRPTLREAMAAKGRAFIRLHYSSTAAASRLSDLVEATVNGHARARTHRSGRDAGVSA
jgi:glycosyltransferase involved in cell wall biosynthesis